MDVIRGSRLLCYVGLLFSLCMFFATVLLTHGCSGTKQDPALRFDRLLVIYFEPEVTEAERSALYERHAVELLQPYGDKPYSYVLFVPDEHDVIAVRDSMKKEPGVEFVGNGMLGPF